MAACWPAKETARRGASCRVAVRTRNKLVGVVCTPARGKQAMSARFSKLEAVDLADEEDTEGEGGSGEDCQVALVLPEDVRKGRRGKRLLNQLRGRKGRLGSWRWVVVAVVAFAIAVFVALMVARLTSEPPSQPTDDNSDNGEQLQGRYIYSINSRKDLY